MGKEFSDVANLMANVVPRGLGKHAMFAFVSKDIPADPSHLAKSPLAALLNLRSRLYPGVGCAEASLNSASRIASGEFLLVEYHLFVHRDEHILATPRPRRLLSATRQHSRRQDASGAHSADVYGHPPIDYEGLPKGDGVCGDSS